MQNLIIFINLIMMPCFKYFINKSVCLKQYREAIQLCYRFKDPELRESMIVLMRDEFEPLRKYRTALDKDDHV